MSHRRGAKITSRMTKNGPGDAKLSWQTMRVVRWLEERAPTLFGEMLDHVLKRESRAAFGEQDPSWRFEPSPSGALGPIATVINEDLIPLVRRGRIRSVHGIRRVVGPKAVELDNGHVLQDIDAIITCTGYHVDMSLTPSVRSETTSRGIGPIPCLYQGIFPPEHASSLAILHYLQVSDNAATTRELSAMALAQLWSGKSTLPSREEMEAQVRARNEWFTDRKLEFPNYVDGMQPGHSWSRWVHDAAGTGMYERMGWGLEAWRAWWADRQLWNIMARGVYTPHMYRVFETGKRSVWEGARREVVRVNEMMKRDF